MRALPLIVAGAAAALLAPSALRSLTAQGHTRANYRGRVLPFPAGFVVVAAAAVALVPLAALQQLANADLFEARTGLVLTYGLGMAILGLIDDVFSGPSRGWRGHAAAVRRGEFSTGALKAVGALGLALVALLGYEHTNGRYLLAVAVLVLATNLFNLLDLRPGRAVKTLALLGAGLTLGAWDARPAAALGLLLGPVLALGFWDVTERAMLGDTGANLIGGLAGLWIVFALGATGQLVALGVLIAVTVYGEFRSISALIERTPVLRTLDLIGRPA